MFKRDYYLQQLIAGKGNGMVKIVTGLRRCGKSFLLFTLFREHLRSEGVADEHVIEVAFDDLRMEAMREPHRFLQYVEARMTDSDTYYILLDEVQLLDRFVEVLNSLLHLRNADVFVTGSNSRFLSRDVATEFRGRGDEIHLYPLSFAEIYEVTGGDRRACLDTYFRYGGLPQVHLLQEEKKREDFLAQLSESVYLRDLQERHRLRNGQELRDLLRVVASGIGSLCSPTKIVNTFRSAKGVRIERKTITRYLTFASDAFLIEESMRYDIKGRKYIGAQSKYYFQDLGLRNALLGFRQQEYPHIMENVVYNELRARGMRVDVGIVSERRGQVRSRVEVDFVAEQGSRRYYIQSAYALSDEQKAQQEKNSLLRIDDVFRRVIVVGDELHHYHDESGILILSIYDFLLRHDSLDW